MQSIFSFIQNHPMLCLGLVVIIILAIILEYVRIRQQAQRITPANAVILMNREQAVVLDIRPSEAFRTGHIPQAISIRPEEFNTPATLIKKITKHRAHPIIILASSDTEAIRMANTLKQHGFDTLILAGGLRAWREAQLPLATKG